jgi:dolichol-phosphate mannosyltransferase
MTVPTVAVLITTRNERATIGDLVLALRAKGYQPYVVDDCSTDGTDRIAEEMGARVLSTTAGHPVGIGPSLIQGWQMLAEFSHPYIVHMDAGGSHTPDDVPWLLAPLEAGQADMVIGSRFRPGSSYQGRRWRQIASQVAAFACNRAQTGAHYSDWSSGFRAFTVDAVRTLLAHRYHGLMHEWQLEVLAHAGADGLKIVEVPIRYRAGRSSMNSRIASDVVGIWLQILNQYGPVRTDHAAAGFAREQARIRRRAL